MAVLGSNRGGFRLIQANDETALIVPGREITITRPADETDWKQRHSNLNFNRHGFSDGTRPLRIAWAGGCVEAPHRWLPFADASVDRIEIVDALETVRNDRRFYLELARIAAPGALLRARVPTTGLLAGFDSFNLYKYLTDITKRGLRIPETEELSFRRHLSLVELTGALGDSFAVQRSWRTGTAISELVNLAALAALTWRREQPDRYLRVQPGLRKLAALDARVPVPGIGFWLHIEARRI